MPASSEATGTTSPRFRVWASRVFWGALVLIIVIPWPAIAWGRAQRSASAPVVVEQVWRQPNGRVTIGAFSFTVDGRSYPARPGEDFALAPARYRCGDPDFLTTDGGW
jgi:hypothetical protein